MNRRSSWQAYSTSADRALAELFDELDEIWAGLVLRWREYRDSTNRVPSKPDAAVHDVPAWMHAEATPRVGLRDQIGRLCRELDILENPPSTKDPPEIIQRYNVQISGLVQRTFDAWVGWMRENGLYEVNERAIGEVQRALHSRSTTTPEKALGQILRRAIRNIVIR